MNSFLATTIHCVYSCTTTTTTIGNFYTKKYLLETLSHCFLAVYKIVEKLSLICNFILLFYLLEKYSNWYFYGVFLRIRVFKKKKERVSVV